MESPIAPLYWFHICLVDIFLLPLCGFEGAFRILNHSGGYDQEATPVPIPNTVVKLFGADDTWLVTARKNRSSPDLIPQ